MASTFTTSLKIQEIGNGEQSGYWGTTTNTNWTLIEQAVAGVQSIVMTNSDYTMTNLNGVSDEARNAVLVVTGTNSAIRKVIAPLNQPKTYIISNQTTGGYAITIGASTGSYITIPNGVTAQVYTDGTNFYSSQTGSAGDFLVNGNLSVSGTSTLTGATTVGSTLGVSGLLTASNGVSSTTGTFSGAVSGTTGTFSGAVSGTTITAATQFSGPGTGLTGTASGLSIGGNAATATTATTATNATNVASGGTIASNVTATTQSAGDNSTKVATTAYVATAVTNATSSLGTMSTQNANNVNITGGSITGITDLAVADGGTGASTFTANSIVLGNGTSALNGNMVAPSTSGNLLVSNGTTWTSTTLASSGIKLGLGITGETWHNLTGVNSAGTTYTNSRAYPIMVTIQLHSGSSGTNPSYIYVNGVVVASVSGGGWTGGMDAPGTTIVPPGATYSTNSSSAGSLWMELY